ncbi:MAG: hypothetical protein KDB01_23615 [Planctomycetaceae bacterium]|nr:hypothetical protein [Planctomycetaceae bacterium]
MSETQTKRVLITVMTYPHPSEGYQELVCTAGITQNLEWVRLYPVDYRYRPRAQQFRKYQWIDVETEKPKPGKDNRPESHRPNLDSIRVVGEPLSTANKWAERREIIDRMPHYTVNELKARFESERMSLGVVRPKRVIDMEIRPVEDINWKADWQKLFRQMKLFGPQQNPLRKIPYTFHYHFECSDSEKPHVAMCEDWELGTLFLRESERLGSDEAAAQSVKGKFLGELCRDDKDTRFFMGTRYPYNVWLVLGVFWPPRILQKSLFDF